MRSDLCHLSMQKPPEFLFYASTVEESHEAFTRGLNRKKKPFIEMFDNERDARMAIRKGHPSLFTVLAGVMAEDGYAFYHAETGEWLTDEIPARYLRIC